MDLLPAGDYTVTITAKGFAGQELSGIGLAVSQTTTLNASPAVGSQQEVVTVEGAAPVVDMRRQT